MRQKTVLLLIYCSFVLTGQAAAKSKTKRNESPAKKTTPETSKDPALVSIDDAHKAFEAEVPKIVCPSEPAAPIPDIVRSEVYKGLPYGAGEKSTFEVRYLGALAGNATIEVRAPQKLEVPGSKKAVWHRNFHVEAKTGEWYRYIFVAHDKLDALIRPWDHGVSKFYMDLDEGQMFGRRMVQKKWLEFDHVNCKVNERSQRQGKPEKNSVQELYYGAKDTLGVAFWVREQPMEVGKTIRTVVYSSEKNWWLEATPVAIEDLTLKAGKFKAAKLKLQTFVGKELQQKGDVHVWIAIDRPEKPLVQIKADIRIGNVFVELVEFKAGAM